MISRVLGSLSILFVFVFASQAQANDDGLTVEIYEISEDAGTGASALMDYTKKKSPFDWEEIRKKKKKTDKKIEDSNSPGGIAGNDKKDDSSTEGPDDDDEDGVVSDAIDILSGKAEDVAVIVESIVNVGKSLWSIVEGGTPVVNVENSSANAIPEGVTNWSQLQGWELPQSKTFRFIIRDYGVKVVSFTYRIMYISGGSYESQGQYLKNVTVLPSDIYVAWFYSFNAQVEIPALVNRGTVEDPIAAMQVVLKWQVNTPFSHREQADIFFVQGDGYLERMQDGVVTTNVED